MIFSRSSGLLLHITSLPSPYGIGDMGSSAFDFADFLHLAGQKYWQLLPLTPTKTFYGNSPYSSPSAFAGNSLLISPEKLAEEGYLQKADLRHTARFKTDKVLFDKVVEFKTVILEKAFLNFLKKKHSGKGFSSFCQENKAWLDDYALFTSLKDRFDNKSWIDWPNDLRDRKPAALKKANQELKEQVEKEKFLQFIFFQQWQELKTYCHQQNIQLIGDIPFYVNHDSADCWANVEYFKLDEEKKPVVVSGVPPDYFSETGQLWGTPVYDWDLLKEKQFGWWIDRIKQNLLLFDVVRLDHFRAFSAFWEVPADEDTAINGKWTKCPGHDFFKKIREIFPSMPFIAEDLGDIDKAVFRLRDKFKLPGMKILLFAFGEGMGNNQYIPHHHPHNSLVYTGTHDNNTVVGWYRNMDKDDRKRLASYTGHQRITYKNVHKIMQRMALSSVADLAILPVQDVLGLGEEAIMNRPGTSTDNWSWRLNPELLTEALAGQLKELNDIYGRLNT
ncbi:4-alpha-glucanotransferase (amylomaltase) [Fulvivirga imtechensis AK7]|uniref:4-alpha-glucanotransferase n=1 Tax=Fulvivirga imtechensis AK7 TaxID=1237149 RepID=L8K2F8_9BACT|nr:4-alpha-glucanotransferase [Fulvivirga imtechensis]ELR73637.1 4-alpha-glucanotransferase (amylomaltase) [Fulvivirga imtechensis AK7]